VGAAFFVYTGNTMTKLRRFRAALALLLSFAFFSPVTVQAEEAQTPGVADSHLDSYLEAIAHNQRTLDQLYLQHVKQTDTASTKTSWLSNSLRAGDEQVTRLVREGENLQRRLIHHAPTQEGPGTVTADSKDAPERVPQKESAVDHQLAMLREEIIVLDEQLRELATVNSSSAEDQEQIKTKRAEKVAELIALLGQRQFLDGSK
jgi:hypothetical protein